MKTLAKEKKAILVASSSTRLWKEFRKALERSFVIYRSQERIDLEIKMARLKPLVGFIDLSIPGLHNLKNVFSLQRLSPSTKIVIIAQQPDEDEEILALKAGIRGYCNRQIDSTLIRRAVLMVQKGKIWVRRGIITRLVEELRSRHPRKRSFDPIKRLTQRQFEVASLISDAASNKEIAGLLSISEAAVKSHLTVIFRKLKISGRVELATLFMEKHRKLNGAITSKD